MRKQNGTSYRCVTGREIKAMNILGIDIGGTKTSVCIGSNQGTILACDRMSSGGRESLDAYQSDLAKLCESVMKQADIQRGTLQVVGISAPGPMNVKQGILISPPNNPGWTNVPIVAMVEDILHVPVFLNNDANACALAEYVFGDYRGTPNMIYLTFSTGMGGGIIMNGQLVQGVTDNGGEVGHHIMDRNGPLCSCGSHGCWEAFVGGRIAAEHLKEKIRSEKVKTSTVEKAGGNIDNISLEAIEDAAREGDPFAVAEWDELAERMAQGIGSLIMILNPQVVLLGTIAIHAGEFIITPIREKLHKYAWKWPLAACKVVPSTLGANIGDLAALAVAGTALDLDFAQPANPNEEQPKQGTS